MTKTLITPQSRIKQVWYTASIGLQGNDLEIRSLLRRKNNEGIDGVFEDFRESQICSGSVRVKQKLG